MAIAEQLGATAPLEMPAAAPRDPTTSEWRSTATRWRPTDILVALLALSPFAVGIVQIIQRGFPPGALFGDRALLGITAIDAWRAPVLLGPYSRFYWHHPGPLYFYMLKASSLVLGRDTVGLVLGAVAINVVAAIGILFLAHRRGGRALLVWASILLTAYVVAVDPMLFDIWNPSVTMLPFVVVLLLAWSITGRDWWAGPWLAFVASFAVQTHVGLAPGVAGAVGFAVFVACWTQRRRGVAMRTDERRTVRRSAAVSVVVAVVCWLPPLVEQFTSRQGNLTLLQQFFARPGSPHTISEGVTNTGLQATLMLRSLFEPISLRADTHQGLTVAVVVTALAFVAAIVLAWKARARAASILLLLVALELVVGVYGVTRIVGSIQYYLVQWISAVAFVLWLAIGNAAIAFARARLTDVPWRRSAMRVAMIAAVVVLCAGAVRALPSGAGRINEDLDVPNNRGLFGYVPSKQLLAVTRPGATVVLRLDSLTAWEVMGADALLLVQHGRDVKIEDSTVTRLLFDDSLRVPRSTTGPVLAFRDRPKPELGPRATLVADQGEWSIVAVDG